MKCQTSQVALLAHESKKPDQQKNIPEEFSADDLFIHIEEGKWTNPHKRIPAREVRELCGGISDMSLWRWLNDEELGFPRPIMIGRRRYWREADVLAWLDEQEAA